MALTALRCWLQAVDRKLNHSKGGVPSILPMDTKALLKALRDDLAATRRSHDLIAAQIAAEEAAYWSTGQPSWIDYKKEATISSAADSLLCRHEQTVKAWYDCLD